MNYRELQEQQRAWLNTNFPNQPRELPLLGVIEEVGEIARCVLKKAQEEMHGPEPRYKDRDWDAELADAIGDTLIYISSACCTMGHELEAVINDTREALKTSPSINKMWLIGALASTAGRLLQYPGLINLRLVVGLLMELSETLGIDFDTAVEQTWSEVKQRMRNQS